MPWFVHSILCFLDLTVIMCVLVAHSFALLYIAFYDYIKTHLSILWSMDISDIFHFACYYKQGTYAYSFTCLQVHMSSISSACILLACRDFHVPLYYLTQIYFESGFNSFHSQIHCMRLPTAPHFYQHKI